MRLVYFGSGEFGLPTLKRLAREHELLLVVTQPDKPAGRSRRLTPTPIGAFAEKSGMRLIKPASVDQSDVVKTIRETTADAFIVIAYGQKLGAPLLRNQFAINLHGSLLPRYRGAAPVNWAVIRNEETTGISVITLADRMDAGAILGQTMTPLDPMETAGELHDRLAQLGPPLIAEVLSRFQAESLSSVEQDESLATRAPKLSKNDGTTSFEMSATLVRARVHGLTPWPGCRVKLGESTLRLHRVKEVLDENELAAPGTILSDGRVACKHGTLEILAVHPAGGKLMSWDAYRAGHDLPREAQLRPLAGDID